MTSTYSTKTTQLLERLNAFFDEHIFPNEARYERGDGGHAPRRRSRGSTCRWSRN